MHPVNPLRPTGNDIPVEIPSPRDPPHPINGADSSELPPSLPHTIRINSTNGANSNTRPFSHRKAPGSNSQPPRSRQTPFTASTAPQRAARERSMSAADRRAHLKLRFLIIGGGR